MELSKKPVYKIEATRALLFYFEIVLLVAKNCTIETEGNLCFLYIHIKNNRKCIKFIER